MNKTIQLLLGLILITGLLTQKQICKHLGFGPSHISSTNVERDTLQNNRTEEDLGSYFVSEQLYEWNDEQADWLPIENTEQS